MATKTALVTGASSGLGIEFARLLAQEGYNLVLVARTESALRQLAEEVKSKYKVEARVIAKDLAQASAPQEIFDELQGAGVPVDVLVNNAGFASYGKFWELKLSGEIEMLQVNMLALVSLTHLFLPAMIQRRSGKILNIGSTASFQPGPLMADYYASKAFVLYFSEAIANELEGTGVTVTALCPGPVQTGFQKRAAIEESKLIKGRKIMDAETAAKAGYKALQQGKTVYIPGLGNRILAQAYRFSPRKMATRVVRNMQERASH
jgi:short-subunit dehydrogenase